MQNNENTTRASGTQGGRMALLAAAFVIGALVLVQAGRLPSNPAYAGTAAVRDSLTLLTASAGRGDDAAPDEVLIVIDNKSEALLVYESDPRTGTVILRDGGPLPVLFRRALNR